MAAAERTDRLIQLSTGLWIDPMTISVVTAMAFSARTAAATHKAVVHIETRAGETHKVPCKDIQGAMKLRDTLAAIANYRGREVQKRKAVDHTGRPMPGDESYRREQARQEAEKAFDAALGR